MGWKKTKTVNGNQFNYWHVGQLVRNNTKGKSVTFDFVLYKNLNAYETKPDEVFQENRFRINLSGDNYPLDSETLKAGGNDIETLIYEKIQELGTLEEIDTDFKEAVKE